MDEYIDLKNIEYVIRFFKGIPASGWVAFLNHLSKREMLDNTKTHMVALMYRHKPKKYFLFYSPILLALSFQSMQWRFIGHLYKQGKKSKFYMGLLATFFTVCWQLKYEKLVKLYDPGVTRNLYLHYGIFVWP